MVVNHASSFLKLWKAKVACKHKSNTDHQQAATPRCLPVYGYVDHKHLKERAWMPGEVRIGRAAGRAPVLEGGAGGTLGSGTTATRAPGGFVPTASRHLHGQMGFYRFHLSSNSKFPLCRTSEPKLRTFF